MLKHTMLYSRERSIITLPRDWQGMLCVRPKQTDADLPGCSSSK